MDDFGSMAWHARTQGRVSGRERLGLITGMLWAAVEGVQLARTARRSGKRATPLSLFEPPSTPMVVAAREHVAAHAGPALRGHVHRTAFWTAFVLHQHGELTPRDLETAWVAALLHDVGLDQPPAEGDFTHAGVELVKELAHRTGWSDEQVHEAGQAISVNLSARVNPERMGRIAWAMNVGGLAELGFPLHRAQMAKERIAELEQRHPRDGLREESMRAIRAEARRVPGGRFAFFRYVFPWIMKD